MLAIVFVRWMCTAVLRQARHNHFSCASFHVAATLMDTQGSQQSATASETAVLEDALAVHVPCLLSVVLSPEIRLLGMAAPHVRALFRRAAAALHLEECNISPCYLCGGSATFRCAAPDEPPINNYTRLLGLSQNSLDLDRRRPATAERIYSPPSGGSI